MGACLDGGLGDISDNARDWLRHVQRDNGDLPSSFHAVSVAWVSEFQNARVLVVRTRS